MTICFTGPQPKELFGYNKENYGKYCNIKDTLMGFLYRFMIDYQIEQVNRHSDEPIDFISGGAQGFDQLAFWAVDGLKGCVDVKFNNILYIPFKNQSKSWTEDGIFGLSNYEQMKKEADKIEYLQDNPTTYYGTTQVLSNRNHRMVDDSDLVIALCYGKNCNWEHEKDGTAECIRYAIKQNKQVLMLTANNGGILHFWDSANIDIYNLYKYKARI